MHTHAYLIKPLCTVAFHGTVITSDIWRQSVPLLWSTGCCC